MLQCVAKDFLHVRVVAVLQRVAVIAVCWSVLQAIAKDLLFARNDCVALSCTDLQCVAVCCSGCLSIVCNILHQRYVLLVIKSFKETRLVSGW